MSIGRKTGVKICLMRGDRTDCIIGFIVTLLVVEVIVYGLEKRAGKREFGGRR
jgi:hypothetical protein